METTEKQEVDPASDQKEFAETTFYRSSNNLNSLEHARNFRNSLFLKEPIDVEKLEFDESGNVKDSSATGNVAFSYSAEDHEPTETSENEDQEFKKRFENSFYSFSDSFHETNHGSDFDDEFDDQERNFLSSTSKNEIQTQTIQFSSSPSLSALAGLLKNNGPSLPKVDTLERIHEEDEAENKTELRKTDSVSNHHSQSSTTDVSDALPLKKLVKPDTVAVRDPPVSVDPTPSSQKVLPIENKSQTSESGNKIQRNPSKNSHAPIVLKKPPQVTSKNKIPQVTNRDKKPLAPSKPKKKSIFSIFRKKQTPSKDNTETLPVSETFSGSPSLLKSNRAQKEVGSTTAKKEQELSKVPGQLNVKKIRNDSVSSTSNASSISDSPVKRSDIRQRKPTPLDFQHRLENFETVSDGKATPEDIPMTPKLMGEDLFPKFLDPSEVESIKSLERNRLSYSSKNGSKRRSLNDSISMNAQNEGMFVEAAGDSFLISTPDLTKSPASSILRNGKFDEDSNRNSFAFSDGTRSNRNSYAFSDTPTNNMNNNFSLGRSPLIADTSKFGSKLSTGNLSASRNSILEKEPSAVSKQSTVQEISEQPVSQVPNTDFFTSDYEDSEYVSEIMEFASIIDFGGDLNFDLDLDIGSTPNMLGLHKSDQFSNEPDFVSGDPRRLDNTPAYIEQSSVAPPHVEVLNNEKTVEENIAVPSNTQDPLQFETPETTNGAFDYEKTFSPTARAYIPDVSSAVNSPRPLSMSFKGLQHDSQLNQSPSFASEMDESIYKDGDVERQSQSNKEVGSGELVGKVAQELPWAEQDVYTAPLGDLNEFSFETDSSWDTGVREPVAPVEIKRNIKFSSKIILYETYAENEYDRRPEMATCNQLTPQLAMMIRDELNELKSTMEVHESSKQYTHFF